MDLLREKQRARGAHRVWGGGGGPDNSAQGMAAIMQAQQSQEQLAWAKDIYNSTQAQRDKASDLSTRVGEQQIAASERQTAIADDSYKEYTDLYRPMERSMVEEAKNYDTPERRAAASATASSDVEKQIAAQRGATARSMERAGVDPSSGKMTEVQAAIDLGAAKAKAGAGNMASKNIEALGAAKRADAVNLGRGISSAQATNAALAMQQGTSGVGNATNAANVAGSGTGNVTQGYSAAGGGLAGAGSSFGNMAAQQSAASAANEKNTIAGVGAVASVAATAASAAGYMTFLAFM